MDSPDEPLLCNACFHDPGLRIMAAKFEGVPSTCPNCRKKNVVALNRAQLMFLAHAFFVRGSEHRPGYGAAPVIQFNEHNAGSLDFKGPLASDVDLLQSKLGIGFFYYGPRLWMVGIIDPLEDLQRPESRSRVIDRILNEYPEIRFEVGQEFYRVRKAPARPDDPKEYDSPPDGLAGMGRLDAPGQPVLYASQDLEVCVHESRFAAGDILYVATLAPHRSLRLLDLSAILEEEGVTEFESLDLAVHMLFLAGNHSYPISREIAAAAAKRGYDGLIYTSYFSQLRTGSVPFETSYGLSHRRWLGATEEELSKIVPNLAIFGHPIAEKTVDVVGINRLMINRVEYGFSFGPARP